MNLSIHWFWRHCACKYHPLVFFIRLEFPPPIDFASGRKERFISFLYRSVTINIPRCMKGNWQAIVLERPVSLDTRAVGSLSKKMRKKEEVIGQLRIQLTRSWRRLLLNCCGRWHTRSVSAPHHRSMKLNSLCHSLSHRAFSLFGLRKDKRQGTTRHQVWEDRTMPSSESNPLRSPEKPTSNFARAVINFRMR